MARSTKEWIGRTDDSPIPPRVKLRIFLRANGFCQECSRPLGDGKPFHCDHIIALVNGGENRESNLQALCVPCHNIKTVEDLKEKCKVARVAMKHLGIKKSGWTIAGRKFDGTPVPSRRRA